MNITFEPERKIVEVTPEQTLLAAAHGSEINITATCGGRGRCNTCRIQVIEGSFTSPTEQELKVLGEKGLHQGFRLSCQAKALSDGVVRIAQPITERAVHILSKTERQNYAVAPDVRKHHLLLPQTFEEKQSSDFEDIQTFAPAIHKIDLPTLQTLPAVIFQAARNVTIVAWEHHLIAVEPGDTTGQLYGLAFDIGTTTVVGYLLDLRTGQELAVASALNGQTRYGGDVMSRITYAQQHKTGLQHLHASIIQTLNTLIDEVCEQAQVSRQQIYEVTIVGNTCMHHLCLQLSPVHLGLAPYLAAIRQRTVVTAAELGLNLWPQSRVVMLPLIAGFVGADTVGVILATGLHHSAELKLAIDIGTNGEIVLGHKDRLLACSTAAGPAFEGAQISHGMRGAVGAIDRVVITEDVHYHVIGEGPAAGICGSGLVDAVAQMLHAGLINPAGRLLSRAELDKHAHVSPLLKNRLVEEPRKRKFILADGAQTAHGEPIAVTQQDIRELQLAKGAIFAGIQMLLAALDVQVADLQEILLAGAFGNYLDKASAVRIGLLPDFPLAKIRSVGNAAGLGAQLALLSGQAKQEADQIARTTGHLALTNHPQFQTTFAEAMAFPGHFA